MSLRELCSKLGGKYVRDSCMLRLGLHETLKITGDNITLNNYAVDESKTVPLPRGIKVLVINSSKLNPVMIITNEVHITCSNVVITEKEGNLAVITL